MNRLIAGAAVFAAVVPAGVALASTVPPDDGYDRTGADTEPAAPVTLSLGYGGNEGGGSGLVAARFAEEVDRATGGSVVIEVQYEMGNDSFEMYTDGDLDLLMSPTKSLSTLGVDTFDVLSLPFLVQDDDQADRVAQSDVVDEMMAGFDAIDATGLLIAPVFAIHLAVAGDEPLRTMEQLQHEVNTSSRDGRLEEIYAAMGFTRVYDDWGNEDSDPATPVAESTVGGSFPDQQPSTIAANWTQYYWFVTMLGHNDSLDALSDVQRAQVMAAAESAAERSISERPREPDAFRDACINGATLTAMPIPLMANIGRAVADTIVSWLQDPAVKHFYDAVKRAAGAHRWTWPDECRDGTTTPYVPPPPPSTEFPFGTYRAEGLTTEQMLAIGVQNDVAVNNESTYIESVIDGDNVTLTLHDADNNVIGEPLVLPAHVDADGYFTILDPGAESTFTWRETADGIELENLSDDPAYLWGDYSNAVADGAFWVRVR